MNKQNPYVCLDLLPGSPAAEIKRRYRQLAKQYHPDANHNVGAENKLRELNAAYAFLSNPARKSAYDAAFKASTAVFVPTRTPLVPRVYRRRGASPRRVFGVAVLLLLFGGVVLFRAENAAPALTRLFSQLSRKPAGPDRPPPSYTFLPSHGAFDDNSDAPAPPPPAQAGMP